MAPLLTQSAVDATFEGTRDTASHLVSEWTKSSKGLRIEARDDLRRLNLETLMTCFFHQSLDCIAGPLPPVLKALDEITHECMLRPNRPRILNWLLYQRKFNSDTQIMRKFAADVIAKRRSQPSSKKDMLYALLHAQDPQTGESLDEQRVIDEIISIIIGAATGAGLVAFAIYYLLKNPHVISKARHEIDSVMEPGALFTHEHLAKLPYCDAVLKESIRLSAAAPGFNIEPLPSTTSPITIAGGQYKIPPKQPIISVLAAVNRDPAVFDDPEAFRPERMLPEAFSKLPKGAQKWFGNGKRECIGKRYGWQWSLVSLVSIIRGVDLELADLGYGLKIDGDFSLKPVDFFVVAKPRADGRS